MARHQTKADLQCSVDLGHGAGGNAAPGPPASPRHLESLIVYAEEPFPNLAVEGRIGRVPSSQPLPLYRLQVLLDSAADHAYCLRRVR